MAEYVVIVITKDKNINLTVNNADFNIKIHKLSKLIVSLQNLKNVFYGSMYFLMTKTGATFIHSK